MTDLPHAEVEVPEGHENPFTMRVMRCDQGAAFHIQDNNDEKIQFMVGPMPPLALADELEMFVEQLRDLGGEKHPRGIERGRWIMGQLIGVARVAASQMEEAGTAIKENSFQVLKDHAEKAYDWVAEGFTGPSESSEHEDK